jgi:DNA-binding transcriptional MerR regulator
MGNDTDEHTFSLDELCSLTNLTKRTIRYYIQVGLVARPIGETRAARYGKEHLESLLTIRRWTDAGLSLERVRELMAGAETPAPLRPRRYGEVEVWSKVAIADGIEVSLDPERAKLTPEQVRQFFADVMSAFEKIQQPEPKQ